MVIPFPDKKYQIIYADPPWKYDFSASCNRDIENQYDTMELKDICNMKIPIDDNAVLFLWATAPKLLEALKVMKSWGFAYRTHLVWDKILIGCGWWYRGQHELLLVGIKGKFSPPQYDKRVSSIFRERRRKHSEKPHLIRELIKDWFPNKNRIELFARHKAEGWDSWGNEELREAYIQDKII